MRLDNKKMSIHISGSDATWSRPPPACPEGRTGNYFVCWFTIMKMRTIRGGAERRKNAGERSRVNAPHRVVFYFSCVLLWHDPKKPAQIPADYICLSSSTNLSSLWLQQTTASTPPLFTPRLQVWPDFGWRKNFWLSMFHKEKKKMMESLWQHVFTVTVLKLKSWKHKRVSKKKSWAEEETVT